VKAVRYDPEAIDEYLAAIGWYFARNRAAADRFVERVLEAETAIREHPPQWSRIEGVPRELEVRRKLVRGFPFAMVYLELALEIRVIALAHSRRRPGYWRGRI
jgi:toxin ParE1/3/4